MASGASLRAGGPSRGVRGEERGGEASEETRSPPRRSQGPADLTVRLVEGEGFATNDEEFRSDPHSAAEGAYGEEGEEAEEAEEGEEQVEREEGEEGGDDGEDGEQGEESVEGEESGAGLAGEAGEEEGEESEEEPEVQEDTLKYARTEEGGREMQNLCSMREVEALEKQAEKSDFRVEVPLSPERLDSDGRESQHLGAALHPLGLMEEFVIQGQLELRGGEGSEERTWIGAEELWVRSDQWRGERVAWPDEEEKEDVAEEEDGDPGEDSDAREEDEPLEDGEAEEGEVRGHVGERHLEYSEQRGEAHEKSGEVQLEKREACDKRARAHLEEGEVSKEFKIWEETRKQLQEQEEKASPQVGEGEGSCEAQLVEGKAKEEGKADERPDAIEEGDPEEEEEIGVDKAEDGAGTEADEEDGEVEGIHINVEGSKVEEEAEDYAAEEEHEAEEEEEGREDEEEEDELLRSEVGEPQEESEATLEREEDVGLQPGRERACCADDDAYAESWSTHQMLSRGGETARMEGGGRGQGAIGGKEAAVYEAQKQDQAVSRKKAERGMQEGRRLGRVGGAVEKMAAVRGSGEDAKIRAGEDFRLLEDVESEPQAWWRKAEQRESSGEEHELEMTSQREHIRLSGSTLAGVFTETGGDQPSPWQRLAAVPWEDCASEQSPEMRAREVSQMLQSEKASRETMASEPTGMLQSENTRLQSELSQARAELAQALAESAFLSRQLQEHEQARSVRIEHAEREVSIAHQRLEEEAAMRETAEKRLEAAERSAGATAKELVEAQQRSERFRMAAEHAERQRLEGERLDKERESAQRERERERERAEAVAEKRSAQREREMEAVAVSSAQQAKELSQVRRQLEAEVEARLRWEARVRRALEKNSSDNLALELRKDLMGRQQAKGGGGGRGVQCGAMDGFDASAEGGVFQCQCDARGSEVGGGEGTRATGEEAISAQAQQREGVEWLHRQGQSSHTVSQDGKSARGETRRGKGVVPVWDDDSSALANWELLANRADHLAHGRAVLTPTVRMDAPSPRDSPSKLLRDACAMLRVERRVELIPVLAQVVRVAVMVPELHRLHGVLCMMWTAARLHFYGEAGLETVDERLPTAKQLEPLLNRWVVDTRHLTEENKVLKTQVSQATDFKLAISIMLGLGPDPSRTEEMLLMHVRDRIWH